MSHPVHETTAQNVGEYRFTFGRYLPLHANVQIRSNTADPSFERTRDLVATARKFAFVDGDAGWFALAQRGRAWYGNGAETFLVAISKQHTELSADDAFNNRETAAWVALAERSHISYVIVAGQPHPERGVVNKFTVGFVSEGHPLDLQVLQDLHDFPLTFRNARQWQPLRTTLSESACRTYRSNVMTPSKK